MVKALRLAGMISALLLPLASCDVLFNGVFSPAVGQVTARADLSASIAAAPAGSFSLSTVSAGGNEFVLLYSTLGFDSTQNHLIVMDPHLKVLTTFTLDALVALPTAGDPFAGNFTMTDVNGQVLVGSILFNASAAGFSFSSKFPSGFSLRGPSVTDLPAFGPALAFNEINFMTISGNLVYSQYNSAWSWVANPFALLGTPSPPPSGPLNVVNVFTDQDSAATPDVVVLQDSGGGSSHMYFLRIPKADINAGINVAIATDPDIFTHAALNYPPVVAKSNLSSQGIAFSRAGIIAYDYQSTSLVQFTLDAPDSVSSLPLKNVNGMKLAAGISGTYCVVWDPVSRTLTRYEQWW